VGSLKDDITLICGFAIFVGLIGTVLPILPGGVLIAIAVLVWALVVQTVAGWLVLVAVVLFITAGAVLKYLTAGKKMVSSGVPNMSLVAGGLLGIVGFFAIPVVGLPLGFVAGLGAAEYYRLRDWRAARNSSLNALGAVGIGILVELGAALLAAATWLAAVLFLDASG
jgi:uncharacterized protein YqgC (DUF456 family)